MPEAVAPNRSGGCLWAIVIAVCVGLVLGIVVLVVAVAQGRFELTTRPGAGPDTTDGLPFDRCTDAPAQARQGVEALLVDRAALDPVVVYRPKESSVIVVVAKVPQLPESLSRAGLRPGAVGIWAFEDGIAASAHPVDFVAIRLSRPGPVVRLSDELAARARTCIAV